MNFEKAMVIELNTVTSLSGKCFPLIAPKGSLAPFLVYRKTSIDHVKTLNGFSGKSKSTYEIFLLAQSYDDLQDMTDALTDKLKSFLGRVIGTGGPAIEDIGIKHNGDGYAIEAELYRADLTIDIKY